MLGAGLTVVDLSRRRCESLRLFGASAQARGSKQDNATASNGLGGIKMTEQDTEEYEDLWTWFKALDAATDAARARIHATLATNRAEGPTSAALILRRRVGEEQKAVRGERATA